MDLVQTSELFAANKCNHISRTKSTFPKLYKSLFRL